MSSRLNEFLKYAWLFVLTIGVAAAVFFNAMYNEQKAQDIYNKLKTQANDLAQLKAKCETIGIKTAGNLAHETN